MSDIAEKFHKEMEEIRKDYLAYYESLKKPEVSDEELKGKPVTKETKIRFVPQSYVYDPEWDEVFDDWYTEYLIYDFDWEY